MDVKIALAGNPNSGKTTLFNSLTGANQYVGNWPGVTVEKKEGLLKSNKKVTVVDLPGIYSLSPYSLEEVVARNFLINEKPDVILNIVDGTNIERNLYLTTQLLELGIPVVVAINMMDAVDKTGKKIDIKVLSAELGCEVVAISALKGTGVEEAAKMSIRAANQTPKLPKQIFSREVEEVISKIEQRIDSTKKDQKRFYAVKLFERDEKISTLFNFTKDIENIIKETESKKDDDSESIIADERYNYITGIINNFYVNTNKDKATTSDKIDRVLTNRFLALPIFATIMFIIYYITITTIGTIATDWANDGVFGDGWHLLGIGSTEYIEASEEYELQIAIKEGFEHAAEEKGLDLETATDLIADIVIDNDDGTQQKLTVAYSNYMIALDAEEPQPETFGIWVPGIPVLASDGLEALNTAPWLTGLIIDGIIGGVGAVLGFVPQMFVLFLFLGFLESSGYMARIAFIMDKIFRKFGLSGKSFIPILIGTGCSVPGIMASRTIENESDRRMTIITTSFMPCGAKLPIIALIAGALFNESAWVAPLAYFVGIGAIVVSGVILKKTRLFSGDTAPFVMELPPYHMPPLKNLLRTMWDRGWSFIKKASSIILLSAVLIWFLSNFGVVEGKFTYVENLSDGLLAALGGAIAWIFTPLGWGDWKSTVATITGLAAKENVVGTFGVLFSESSEVTGSLWDKLAAAYTPLAGFSFLLFNLLCAPCFAAVSTIKKEMRSRKWTAFAIGYQTFIAYVTALCVYQLGLFIANGVFGIGTIVAFIFVILFLVLIFRPVKKHTN